MNELKNIDTIKYSIEAFSDAFRAVVEREHVQGKDIVRMFDNAIDHLIAAEKYWTIVARHPDDIDRDDYAYQYGVSVRSAVECLEDIQSISESIISCQYVKMALNGACKMICLDLSEIH